MAKRSTFSTMLRGAIVPAVVVIVIVGLGTYTVLGPNGARAYGDVKRQLSVREVQLAALKTKRAEWQNKVALLDPKRADPDMVDELTREKLNVVHPDEVIVPLN
ncbi:FtsB family cell division protein [Sphingomonas sp. PB4P5]|uniref:FtsB family cell division protein n=1 Tax=Parasphingomonas puruogangriensis TaxID=3096155 RepID=UPI002FC631D5